MKVTTGLCNRSNPRVLFSQEMLEYCWILGSALEEAPNIPYACVPNSQRGSLAAHDCGYPLSRYTCRATRVAADFQDFRAFCRCSTGVALHPLKILVSHLPPPPLGNEKSARSFSDRSFFMDVRAGCPFRNACFSRIWRG